MTKILFLVLFSLVLGAESAAQLKTIEIKKNIWTWTGTQYFMDEQKIRVPEIQLHLDKYHPEAGKAFRSGRVPITWGWVTLGGAFGVVLYDLFVYEPPKGQSFDALFWANIGLLATSGYLLGKGQKRRKNALNTYNEFVRR